jgi:hypothetical protein
MITHDLLRITTAKLLFFLKQSANFVTLRQQMKKKDEE